MVDPRARRYGGDGLASPGSDCSSNVNTNNGLHISSPDNKTNERPHQGGMTSVTNKIPRCRTETMNTSVVERDTVGGMAELGDICRPLVRRGAMPAPGEEVSNT